MTAAATAGLAVVLIAHATGGSHSLAAGAGTPPANGGGASSGGTSRQGGSGGSGGSNNSGPSTTAPGSAAAGGVRSATGAVEQYGYGQMAVSVTVSGSKITQIAVAQLQTAESYSQQLAQQVIPMLRGEVLSAQSAQISAVSGATYTSQAYAASVQSALDKLHAK
jgi:uncharacterized protein with FMN-binding domain